MGHKEESTEKNSLWEMREARTLLGGLKGFNVCGLGQALHMAVLIRSEDT